MLPKINRLTKDKEFDAVFKRGRSNYDKIVGVKIMANKADVNRFGILISSKVSKKAVIRNKLKRQIRDILFKENDFLKVGYDFVIITLPEIRDKDSAEIKEALLNSFKKLRLYR